MNSMFYLLLFAFIGSVAGLIGGVVLLFKEKWAKSLASVSVPLAAGVLLAVALLDILPEAVEEVGNLTFTIVLFVFVALFMVERFFFFLHHHQQESDHHIGHRHSEESTVSLVIFGDTIHNFLDGVAIGAAFLVNPSLALIVSLSTFLHETPHEIADFGILLAKGWKKQKAFNANLVSALATFPGAILTYYFADTLEAGVGILLSIAAGFFLYVATTDFLPEAQHSTRGSLGKQAFFLVIGVGIVMISRMFFPEIGQ